MPNLELKIHPPIVLLISGSLAWGLSQIFVSPSFIDNSLRIPLCLLLAGSGIVLAAIAVFGFHHANTTIHPTSPEETSALVTTGVYQFTRNPMYLGLLLILSAWVVMLGNPFSLTSLIVFVVYISRFQIQPEERILGAKFGDAYEDYCHKVRRWI